MFALILVGALVGQSLAAPSSCGTASVCDHQTGRQIGQSSYSKWGSSSSWSSGSTSGGGLNAPARLENLDEDGQNVITGLERPGSWHDEQHYVTDDRKGKIDYHAKQEVTGNSFRKEASTSYRYGSHDQHELQPDTQLIHHSQFDSQIQSIEARIRELMGRFSSFGFGSKVDQQTLDSFNQQAQRLSSQVNSLCNQAVGDAQAYQQLQQIQQNLQQQVEQKQQQLMSFAFDVKTSHTITGSGGVSGVTSVQQPQQPQQPYTRPTYPSAPVYHVPQPTTPSARQVQAENIQQECTQLRHSIDEFYSQYVAQSNSLETEAALTTFRNQVQAQIAAINQRIANLRVESASFDYEAQLLERLSANFEGYVKSLNQRIADCETRIKNEQLRLIEEQERLTKERLEQEQREADAKYQQTLREFERRHQEEQAEIARQRAEAAERERLQKLETEQTWRRHEEERLRIIHEQEQQLRETTERLKQQQQYRPAPLPQQQIATPQPAVVEVSPSGHVSGGYESKVQVHVSGSHHVSTSGSGGIASQQQQQQYQPVQIGPHVDFTDVFNKMNQEYNKLVTSVSGLGGYSMQLTANNQASVNAQFQSEAARLRQNIESLCEQSSRYHNDQLLQAAEQLKQSLEQSYSFFQQELAKMSASGGYQDNSEWQAGGRYTKVTQPRISNVEYSHSKSTELEFSGRRGNGAAGQRVLCVEQEAGQPCIVPQRKRREAGGYYSQQRESNYDEYTPRRNRHQRRRTYSPESEDYSQQHIDPQLELDQYSQRTGQDQLPRERQPIRGENYRRHGYESQQQDQVEDLTQLEDRHSQRNQQHGSRYGQQESEDLSQQYVQQGQHEDFSSYQKPRRERIQETPKFERSEDFDEPNIQGDERQHGNQQVQTANLQREQSSASTGRTLLDQRLVVDEPQEFVKPIVRPGAVRGVDDQTLEKSGFYDNPKLQENSKLQDNVQQNYERPNEAQAIEVHGKSRQEQEEQKPHILSDADLTLENSGFDDNQQQYQQQAVTESSPEQVTTFKNIDNSQQSEDLTLQKSGFFENPGRGQQSRVPENQQHEDLVQQNNFNARDEQVGQTVDGDSSQQSTGQANFGPDVQTGRRQSNLRQERVHSYDNVQRNPVTPASPTQDREHEPRNTHPRGQYIHHLPQQNVQSSENVIDLDGPNVQFNNAGSQGNNFAASNPENQESETMYPPVRPTPIPESRYPRPGQVNNAGDQYNHFAQSNQENQESVTMYPPVRPTPIPESRYPRPGQVNNAGDQYNHFAQSNQENQESVTMYPRVRPTPIPESRYPRPGRVGQNVNVPQQMENEYLEQSGNQSADSEYYAPSRNEYGNLRESHRGDLPGHSEPVSEEPVYIPPPITPAPTERPTPAPTVRPTPAPTFRPNTQAPIVPEKPNQSIVDPEVPTERTPCYSNRCQFGQTGQSYYWRQQHQQNIRFSQSIYGNRQNIGSSGYQLLNSFYPQNGQTQFNQQVTAVSRVPDNGYNFRYKDEQTNHLRINHQGSTHPSTQTTAFEQNDLLGLNGQSSQQVQQPIFDNSPRRRGYSQRHSTFTFNQQTIPTPDSGFPAMVIPLGETQSGSRWAAIESTTQLPFWNTSGQQSSNTHQSVRQSSRTVYG